MLSDSQFWIQLTYLGGLFCFSTGCALLKQQTPSVPEVPMIVSTDEAQSASRVLSSRDAWPPVFYQSTSYVQDPTILYTLSGRFQYGMFEMRETHAPAENDVLPWPERGNCSVGCVDLSLEKGVPPEFVFWFGLATWFATLDEWDDAKIREMGFGTKKHGVQSLAKDYMENAETIVQEIEREQLVFIPSVGVECSVKSEIFAEDVDGGTLNAQIENWIAEISKESAGRSNTAGLYFHSDSRVDFAQTRVSNGVLLSLKMSDQFEDGGMSVLSEYTLQCHGSDPLWAKDFTNRYTLTFQREDQHGIHFRFGQAALNR